MIQHTPTKTAVLLSTVLLVVAIMAISSPVAAQEVSGNVSVGDSSDEPAATQIDENTLLHESGYNADTGMAYAVVEIRGDVPRTITLGSFAGPGVVPTNSQTVLPDTKTRIEVPARSAEGFLSIANSEVSYLVELEGSTQIFGVGAQWQYVQVAGAIGFLAGFLGILVTGYLTKRGGKANVEKIA